MNDLEGNSSWRVWLCWVEVVVPSQCLALQEAKDNKGSGVHFHCTWWGKFDGAQWLALWSNGDRGSGTHSIALSRSGTS
jgi:hypothetical protein